MNRAEVKKAVERMVESQRRHRIWLSDDTVPTVMSDYDMHRMHKEEPYLGCVFCWDQFVPKEKVESLRSALRLAVTAFEQLTNPDPQKGILTNIKMQGEAQGISLDETYGAVLQLTEVLRAELGESLEGIDHLAGGPESRSVAEELVGLREELSQMRSVEEAARDPRFSDEYIGNIYRRQLAISTRAKS